MLISLWHETVMRHVFGLATYCSLCFENVQVILNINYGICGTCSLGYRVYHAKYRIYNHLTVISYQDVFRYKYRYLNKIIF